MSNFHDRPAQSRYHTILLRYRTLHVSGRFDIRIFQFKKSPTAIRLFLIGAQVILSACKDEKVRYDLHDVLHINARRAGHDIIYLYS